MLKLVRPILIILFFMLIFVSAKSQKWQPGHFTDVKNNRLEGLIRISNSGKGPIKDEAYIVYKENKNAPEIKLSASDIKNFTAGADSFVVAHPPAGQVWQNETDFLKVILDEPLKLYVLNGKGAGGGGGFHISPGIGLGVGGGSYGGYGGAGVGIGIGGGGNGGRLKQLFYFGANTAELTMITPMNFEDVMAEIMGDYPEVVDKIRAHQFGLGNLDKLINYYRQIQAAQK